MNFDVNFLNYFADIPVNYENTTFTEEITARITNFDGGDWTSILFFTFFVYALINNIFNPSDSNSDGDFSDFDGGDSGGGDGGGGD